VVFEKVLVSRNGKKYSFFTKYKSVIEKYFVNHGRGIKVIQEPVGNRFLQNKKDKMAL